MKMTSSDGEKSSFQFVQLVSRFPKALITRTEEEWKWKTAAVGAGEGKSIIKIFAPNCHIHDKYFLKTSARVCCEKKVFQRQAKEKKQKRNFCVSGG